MRLPLLTALALSAFCVATSAQAQGRPEHLVLGAGYFDALEGDDGSAQFGAEYRSRYIVGGLRPVAGVSMNTDGGLYAYGGVNYDIGLFSGITVTPGFAVGKWNNRESKDLGGDLQFRSSAEISYTMSDKSRLGVVIDHMSNAGLEDRNPGVETIMLNYAHPISILGPN